MSIVKYLITIGLSILIWSCLSEKPTPESVVTPPTTTTPVVPTTPNTPVVCDTVSISYDKTIVPILQNNCTSCHGGTTISGNVDLSTYTGVATVIKNGKLYGAVTHTTGYIPMPSSSQKLSDCNILQIKKWIVAGYPNGATVIVANPTNPVNPVVPPIVSPPVILPNTDACDPNVVYFQQKILPMIISSCATSGCHDSKTRADGYELTSYKTIVSKGIDTKNPSKSKLYTEMLGSMPPKPNTALSKTQTDLFLKWIQQGALDNSCEISAANCNTSTVTFATVIVPILQNSCTGCHNANTTSGGINLSTFAGVSVVAKNGKLYGAVAHATGFVPMPSTNSSLSLCEISQIKKWIDNGVKND
jgi:hypothetical protein